MNKESAFHAVADSNVNLSPEDAATIAAYRHAVGLPPGPAIIAPPPVTVAPTVAAPKARREIEALQNARFTASADATRAKLLGTRGECRRANLLCLRIDRQLDRARREAFKEFAYPRRWKYEANLSASELHTESLRMTWCETCGGLCQLGGGYLHDSHSSGKHDAFRNRRNYNGRTEAVMHHTLHPFAACAAFAALFKLTATPLDWSWYGPAFTAVLLTRGGK